jgi:hypothetical protein
MKPIERSEILPLGAYEEVRERFRARVLAEKRPRYVALGDRMTVLFENRDTVLLQIQEMLRTERISSEPGIRHEIDTYNELVPGDRELSMTVFIEIDERSERERMLVALSGVEDRFSITVNGERFGVVPDRRGTDPTRTMAVQYVKVPLSEQAAAALRDGNAEVTLGVEHPAYSRETLLARETLSSLSRDFHG